MTENAQTIARTAIGALLDGASPNGADPGQMGSFGDCYAEMVRAFYQGETEAARRVFATCAEKNPEIAALRAGDPEPRKLSWSTAELLAAQFPDPIWIVPDMITTGLTVLAGRPKLGKSWLSLQIAVAVGSGGSVLGRTVEPGRVLYLALEDNERRIQERLNKQRAGSGADVTFQFESEPLTGKGTADLMLAINQHGYRLVIIDTLSRALGRADQMDQADMNVTMGALQRLAIEKDVAVLMVDHHRKSAGGVGDVIDDVMGATSKVGVADAAMGLYRERGQPGATLKVTGRDIDDQELALQWDVELFCWQLTGTAAGVRQDTMQNDILTALEALGGEATITELAKFLDKKQPNVYRELTELVAKRLVAKGKRRGRSQPYVIVDDYHGDDNDNRE